jgi:hypothetical protein
MKFLMIKKYLLKIFAITALCNFIGLSLFCAIWFLVFHLPIKELKLALGIFIIISSLSFIFLIPEFFIIFLFYFLKIRINYPRILITTFFLVNIFCPQWLVTFFFDKGEYFGLYFLMAPIILISSAFFYFISKKTNITLVKNHQALKIQQKALYSLILIFFVIGIGLSAYLLKYNHIMNLVYVMPTIMLDMLFYLLGIFAIWINRDTYQSNGN